MKPYRLSDQAERDIDEAMTWYDQQQVGVSWEFHNELLDIFRKICEHPEHGSLVGSTQFRYRNVHRFPYVVYYDNTTDSIDILAVAHGSRKPEYWRS